MTTLDINKTISTLEGIVHTLKDRRLSVDEKLKRLGDMLDALEQR